MKLYKYLKYDGSSIYGHGKWSLPTEDGPGEWMPPIEGELEPCKNGYHACREDQLHLWSGDRLYELEHDGEVLEHRHDKVIVRRARLLRRMVILGDHLVPRDSPEHLRHIRSHERAELGRYLRRALDDAWIHFPSADSIRTNLGAVAEHYDECQSVLDDVRGEIEPRLALYAKHVQRMREEKDKAGEMLLGMTDLLYEAAGWEVNATGGYRPKKEQVK